MAVNKNFVVKNGLEVATDAIIVNAASKNVGLGSTAPSFTLDVRGGIGVTDLSVTGFSTVTQGLQVGTSGSGFYVNPSSNLIGVGTYVPEYLLDVRSSVSTGTTALYIGGDAYVTGKLNSDNIYTERIRTVNIDASTGIVTAKEFHGTAQIGIASEGTFIGAGVTEIDFKSTTGDNVQAVVLNAGIATVTIEPGVSLGLAIALGGA